MFNSVLKLLGATSVSQFLPILVLPFLTLYLSPEVFGYLGSFISLSLIVSVMITLRFEPSIVLCGSECKTQAENIRTITLFTTALTILVVYIISFFYEIPVSVFICFILTIFSVSGNKVVEQFLIAQEKYGEVSKNKLILALSTVLAHIFITFSIGQGDFVLVYSYTFSLVVCSLLFLYKSNLSPIPSLNIASKNLLQKHKRFCQYEMPSDFVFQLSQNLPVVIIMTVFGAEIAGIYSIAEKMILLPVAMIGSTLGMVYYKEMSKEKTNVEQSKLVRFILNCLFGIVIFGVCTYFFSIDFLVELVFEDQYTNLSNYTDYLILYGVVLFVSSPLSGALWKAGKQNVNLGLSIITFFLRCVCFYIVSMHFDFYTSLLFLVVASILPRIMLLCFCMKVLSLNFIEMFIYIILLLLTISSSYLVLL
ncbi:TPA: lipopolysaccharide biosynthesis protein [Vibrio vulnificus]|nr:oligosaccharide flippase family protein [Vibrio vulnificus]HDY7478596.1 oligosaccharide flippase family protein [Vibrio vulnificus]